MRASSCSCRPAVNVRRIEDATLDELVAQGLYDPDAPDAATRLRLLEHLLDSGLTYDDLVEFKDDLVAASMVRLRPHGHRMSQREIAAAAGLGDDDMARLWSAFGLPHSDPDAPVGFEQSVELFALFAVGRDLLGTETAIQLARLIGEMNARLADALVSTFIVSVGGPATYADPTLLSLAEANTSAATLIDPFVQAFGILLRHHLDIARRPVTVAAAPEPPPSYEVRTMAIGFADLSGSTALEGRLSFGELGGALTEFEERCAEIVNRGGGRVVKLIGDEVMFTAPDIGGACEIACGLVDAVAADPVLPPLRAGIAAGEVLARYGDCFGPVVNLAARLTNVASPGCVVAPSALAPEIEGGGGRYAATPNGAVHLRGFTDDVATVVVSRR